MNDFSLDAWAWWGLQAITSLVLAVIFASIGIRTVMMARKAGRRRETIEYGLVVFATLSLVSFGNAVTSYASWTGDPEMRTTAGVLIRATLAVCAVYLLTSGRGVWGSPR